jgi:hypothetical protein
MQKKLVGVKVRHGAFEVLDERLRGDGLWGIESPRLAEHATKPL